MFYRFQAIYKYAFDDWRFSSYLSSPPFPLLLRRSFNILINRCQTTGIPATFNRTQSDNLNRSNQSGPSKQPSISDPMNCQSPRQTEPDLLYLNILNDAVKETTKSSRHHTTSSTPYRPSPEDGPTPRKCLWTKVPQLDDIDNEYLVKKGVFDLPSPCHL
jgi:hypothetical protein